MKYGLEIINSTGTVEITENTRLTRIVQRTAYSLAVGASVNISVPGISLDGTWGAMLSNTYYQPSMRIQNGYVTLANEGANVGTISGELIIFRF